jgi:hypothetical protein
MVLRSSTHFLNFIGVLSMNVITAHLDQSVRGFSEDLLDVYDIVGADSAVSYQAMLLLSQLIASLCLADLVGVGHFRIGKRLSELCPQDVIQVFLVFDGLKSLTRDWKGENFWKLIVLFDGMGHKSMRKFLVDGVSTPDDVLCHGYL